MGMQVTQRHAKEDSASAHSSSRALPVAHISESRNAAAILLNLQRTHGNTFVQHLLNDFPRPQIGGVQPSVQTKLSVSQPGDEYEQEADAVAEQVVRRQEAVTNQKSIPEISLAALSVRRMIHRQASSFPEDSEDQMKKQVQRKGEGVNAGAPMLEHKLNALAGSGQPIAREVQRRMEQAFGASFDDVRIHTDAEAADLSRSLNAQAFTYGRDIYFGADKSDFSTRSGAELLAHELTHTLQQTGIKRKTIQRRGGPAVGQLDVQTNVVNEGLTAGHAWLAYTTIAGVRHTHGTWGNRPHVGYNLDEEVTYPAKASRRTALDAADHTALLGFIAANDDWGYINNCASFAGRGWATVTGESLSYRNMFGIPNPSSLGGSIAAAGGLLAAAPQQ